MNPLIYSDTFTPLMDQIKFKKLFCPKGENKHRNDQWIPNSVSNGELLQFESVQYPQTWGQKWTGGNTFEIAVCLVKQSFWYSHETNSKHFKIWGSQTVRKDGQKQVWIRVERFKEGMLF